MMLLLCSYAQLLYISIKHNAQCIKYTCTVFINDNKGCTSARAPVRRCVILHQYVPVPGRPASGNCLCNGRHLDRRPFPVTATCSGLPISVTAVFAVDIELTYRQLPLHSSPALCLMLVWPCGPLLHQRPAKALDV